MTLPEGYRLAGDDEPITKEMSRGHRFGEKVSKTSQPTFGQIGQTTAQLRAAGHIGATRVFLVPISSEYPHFDGWFPIGVDAPCIPSDVAVMVKEPKHGAYQNYKTPDTGLGVSTSLNGIKEGMSMRQAYPEDTNIKAGVWCVYRKVGESGTWRKPSRLPPNPERLTKPLPLP